MTKIYRYNKKWGARWDGWEFIGLLLGATLIGLLVLLKLIFLGALLVGLTVIGFAHTWIWLEHVIRVFVSLRW